MNFRAILAVAGITIVLTACMAISLLGSLNFTFEGEPGFDPAAAQRAEIFSQIFAVLGFPIVTVILRFPGLPLTSGLLGWVWLALNSLLWALAIYGLYRFIKHRRSPNSAPSPENFV